MIKILEAIERVKSSIEAFKKQGKKGLPAFTFTDDDRWRVGTYDGVEFWAADEESKKGDTYFIIKGSDYATNRTVNDIPSER